MKNYRPDKSGERLKAQTGSPGLDFLINNAGTGLYSRATSTTEKQLDTIVNIHYKAVFFLTQKALPYIKDGGVIINISYGLTVLPHVIKMQEKGANKTS